MGIATGRATGIATGIAMVSQLLRIELIEGPRILQLNQVKKAK